MEQIKSDLAVIAANETEHPRYIAFVRDIISLIKSQDICPINKFFYQISREYCPSLQDPRFDVAGIVAYGVRLGEGDNAAAQSLFYYLLNNFKRAIMNDTLGNEVSVLKTVMRRDDQVLSFILSKLLPSIIMSSQQLVEVYPLLDVYRAALSDLLAGTVVPRQLDEDMLPHLQALLSAIVECLSSLASQSDYLYPKERTHGIRQIVSIVNLFSLSVKTHALLHPDAAGLGEILTAIKDLKRWATVTRTRMRGGMRMPFSQVPGQEEDASDQRRETVFRPSDQVSAFTGDIIMDVRKHWVFTGGRITVPALRNASSGQTALQCMKGTAEASLDYETCARGLLFEIERLGEKYEWVREQDSELELELEWRPRVPRLRSYGIEECLF